ncbi:MAG: type III secretion system chaperone [Verrucomicrobia bacterium]|nr:type III secretion system chaperone [Verrucomicrobiota bacterium]
MLEPFINTIVADLELGPPPQKEEGNVYKLNLNPQISIVIKELDPGVSFWGRIGPCPTIKKEELFILLMKANFLGQGTGGAAIALDENENFLTLSSVLPYDMNYKMFKDALEDFANFLDYWREELIRHKKAAEENIL